MVRQPAPPHRGRRPARGANGPSPEVSRRSPEPLAAAIGRSKPRHFVIIDPIAVNPASLTDVVGLLDFNKIVNRLQRRARSSSITARP
jgi:hypothetical protein